MMNTADPTRQLTFRLPEPLIERVENCVDHFQRTGLNVTRADVVRLLITHALDMTRCNLRKLLSSAPDTPAAPDRRHRNGRGSRGTRRSAAKR
jgi:hypothetical protein